MSTSNAVHMVGNLTDDPSLRFTTTGKPVSNIRVAVNERIQVNGMWADRTNYLTVVVWDTLAEHAAVSLHKGDRVQFSGRLQIREAEYVNKTTGEKTTSYFTEVIATEMAVSLRFATVHGIERQRRSQPAQADLKVVEEAKEDAAA